MSTKKKPASKSADGKSAADKGPQPLLKLKFEKFPDKPVAVYFDVTKRLFRATFGFNEHEATSVGALCALWGRNAQAAVDQVISTVQRSQGAIAKLNELVDGMQPEDPPLAIPSVILVAAGFTEKATAEIYDPQEILVRNPKKAVRVITLHELEQMILDQIKSTEAMPEKELVGA